MDPARRGWSPYLARGSQEATEAGLHGVIVSAAVMAAAHAPTAITTVVAVLVTLAIYWASERYARIVAERIHQGHRPSRQTLRAQLTSGWEMISASLLPLAVLVVARLLGAELRAAVIWGLICSTVLLAAAGWHIGRGGRLTLRERLVSSAVASLFGIAMIFLKTLLH